MGENVDNRDYNELEQAIELAQHTVYKRYLDKLETYPLVAPTQILLDEKPQECLRLILLEELSSKKGEDIFQKLSTVYFASMSLGCSLVMIVDVEKNDAPAKIYVGVRNDGKDEDAIKSLRASFEALKNGIRSNFPGTKFRNISVAELTGQNDGKEEEVNSEDKKRGILNEIFGEEARYISSVSCVASIRDKSKTENKTFVQGLERFIDAMKGNVYTAVFIAEPVSAEVQHEIRSGYETLYSTLSPFAKSTWSYNEGESNSVMESLSKSVSKSVAEGTSHTQGHTVNVGVNLGVESTKNRSTTEGVQVSHEKSGPTTTARIGNVLANPVTSKILISGGMKLAAIFPPAAALGVVAGAVAPIVGSAMQGGSVSDGITRSISNTVGQSLGVSGGVSAGYAKTVEDTVSHSETNGETDTKTKGNTDTRSMGRTLQTEMENKSIGEMLEQIEEQLKRIREGEDYGAYNVGAYFLAPKRDNSILASTTYRSLMIGDGSSVESGAINFWGGNGEENEAMVTSIKQYLCRAVHPIFAVPMQEDGDIITYSPGTMVSGLELPLHIGLPIRSIYGLPVLEHAEFGRNVVSRVQDTETNGQKGIALGKIYHMGQMEKVEVKLDSRILTEHTFISGSTGSGKSNTIYKMLGELNSKGIPFLVIEPAKGEYKTVFGEKEGVMVYGTNPKIMDMQMLHLNPFRFPKNIHVLEHLDRLVEIFNVCWPMYAAMPAILKDAIERAYMMAGWDLMKSENCYDNNLFPTFSDVLKQIKAVLEESDYSADNKGDYTGSLVTRIRSLTNGINGLIFVADDIADEKLFDVNAIVDLSRIGSTETKALVMGILVLKLQEYRMERSLPNSALKHVTVLEEAHNLLKRTSTEQVGENANLLGKSVEMLSNSIAEMRTYGEGFVIADQSPSLLDLSVIRNTNTKIILKLPDFSDRKLVGKAAGLNDDQIVELGRLERGVASVTQSGWLEPVLCKIDKFNEKCKWRIDYEVRLMENKSKNAEESLLDCIMNKEIYRKNDRVDIRKLWEMIIRSGVETTVKCEFLDYVNADDDEAVDKLRCLVFDFFHAQEVVEEACKYSDIKEWAKFVADSITPSVKGYDDQQINLLLALILDEQAVRDAKYKDVYYRFTEVYRQEGKVF